MRCPAALVALLAVACAAPVAADGVQLEHGTAPAAIVLEPLEAPPVPALAPALAPAAAHAQAMYADVDVEPAPPTVPAPIVVSEPEPVPESELEVALEPVPVPAPLETFSVSGRGEYPNTSKAARKPTETLTLALRDALDRWTAATCVRFEILPEGGQHSVQYATPDELVGRRVGQVVGQWDAALVQVSDFVRYGAAKRVLLHELGHLLSNNNGHSADGVLSADLFAEGNEIITDAALTQVCATLECTCFAPEG